jgi:DNA-binding MarR family transcriptional regulator
VMARDVGEDLAIPALLRVGLAAYASAIGQRLDEAGFGDLPRNGPFVLGGLARYGGAVRGLVEDLNVSKQAASQLIDVLVSRGYIERRVQPHDRRRIGIELTDRGRAAAVLIRATVEAVDAQVAARVSARDLAGLRRGLAALADIKR